MEDIEGYFDEEEDEEEELDEEEEDEEDDEEDGDIAPTKKRKNTFRSFSGSPREGLAAFFLYAEENYRRAMDECETEGWGAVASVLSQEFKSLDATEREHWELKAENTEIDFKELLKEYEENGPTTKKKKKDPDAPKRHKSAFLIFSMENRERVVRDHPELSFGNIAKKISEYFNDLSPEEQQKWHAKAAADKERYKKEMVDWNTQKASEKDEDDDSDADLS